MKSRFEMNGDFIGKRHARAPVIGFGSQRPIVCGEDRIIAKREQNARAALPVEGRQGRQIEMIVVIVGNQNCIDRREIAKRHSWSDDASGTRPLHGAGALGVNGVDQKIEAARLDQETRVTNRRYAQRSAFDPGRRPVGERARIGFRPARPPPASAPPQQVG